MRDLVHLRDGHCVFPSCQVDARSCDLDHTIPYDQNGPPGQTRPENLACLCRRHHRAKTTGRWRYLRTPDGDYLWHGPYGTTYLVTDQGTRRLCSPRPRTHAAMARIVSTVIRSTVLVVCRSRPCRHRGLRPPDASEQSADALSRYRDLDPAERWTGLMTYRHTVSCGTGGPNRSCRLIASLDESGAQAGDDQLSAVSMSIQSRLSVGHVDARMRRRGTGMPSRSPLRTSPA